MDAESEHLVKEAIDRAMINRTVLVIAHRLSTVRSANTVSIIVWLFHINYHSCDGGNDDIDNSNNDHLG